MEQKQIKDLSEEKVYLTAQNENIRELTIIQVSPSGDYTKIQFSDNPTAFWIPSITPVSVLESWDKP